MADDQTPMTTLILPFGAEAIARAGGLIGEGQPVAVPTETVYGLAADARNADAVARIYAAKGRPDFNPLIVHVLDAAQAENIAVLDDRARALAAALTMSCWAAYRRELCFRSLPASHLLSSWSSD